MSVPLWRGPRESWRYFTSWWVHYVILGVTVFLVALLALSVGPTNWVLIVEAFGQIDILVNNA